jgi:coronin-1B/1C/6
MRCDDKSIFTCNAHTGPVIDFDFNPFNDSQIVSCSEDCSIKLWEIPEGGLTANLDAAKADIGHHDRKVTSVHFHPTAEGVLLSTGMENSVKLWDVNACKELNVCADQHPDIIQDVAWDWCGNNYATSCKDRGIRVVDARSATVTTTIENAHTGAKAIKIVYAGDKEKLISTGFLRGSSKRQMKIWDPRNSSEALTTVDLDSASGVVLPFYDNDTSMVYLCAKGDTAMRYFEILDDKPYYMDCAVFRSHNPMKGACMVPKRKCNIGQNELARIMKLTTNSVEPVSFALPRRAESFQNDLYPDTCAGVPAHSCAEWLGGSMKGPMIMSLDPGADHSPRMSEYASMSGGSSAKYVAPKTAAELQKELDTANNRIALLEKKLAEANISV